MNTPVRLTGELPSGCAGALRELADDLGLIPGGRGVELRGVRGDGPAVHCPGAGGPVTVTWREPVQFYRALSLLPRPLAACDVRERPCFRTVGMMFDVSRNAVLRPEALRFFFRKMALMGLNLGMMYTEDTYEVPGQPYFGYQRGRYSSEELRALDEYAARLGIELCPCIQTLGHLNRALHWPALAHLKDNEEVLLADDEATYRFLEQLIAAASAPYRSRRIHIGMDEAHGVGLGAHLRRFGYEDAHAILRRHLERVLEITRRHGLEPMMWSDMYFRPDSPTGGYYDSGMPSRGAAESVVPGVTLVYWDYYHEREEEYAQMLDKHAALRAPTAFAGGIWTWCGPAPDYAKTAAASVPALRACKKAGVSTVFAAAWGDNGAETCLLAALPGMQLYAEFCYRGEYCAQDVRRRFERCCGAPAQAFADLTQFNAVPGMRSGPLRPVNAAKFLLYQDPLVQLYAADTEGLDMSGHYARLCETFERHCAEAPAYGLFFRFYALLAKALADKCRWHERAAAAARRKDPREATALAGELGETIAGVEALRRAWRALWESVNKPQGFEIIDLRLGGVAARLATARERMLDLAAGRCAEIPELAEPPLPYTRQADGTLFGSYAVGEIVSACKLDL